MTCSLDSPNNHTHFLKILLAPFYCYTPIGNVLGGTKIHYTELGPCQTKERGFGGMTRSQTAVSGGVSEHKMTREQNPTLNPVVLKIEKNRDVFLDIYSQFVQGWRMRSISATIENIHFNT